MKQYFGHNLRDYLKQHISPEARLSMLAIDQVMRLVRIGNKVVIIAMSARVLMHIRESIRL